MLCTASLRKSVTFVLYPCILAEIGHLCVIPLNPCGNRPPLCYTLAENGKLYYALAITSLFHYTLAITSFIPLRPAKRGKPYSTVVLQKAVSFPLYCTLEENYKRYSTLPLQSPVMGHLQGCTVPLQKLVSYPMYCSLSEIGQLPHVLFPLRNWPASRVLIPCRKW